MDLSNVPFPGFNPISAINDWQLQAWWCNTYNDYLYQQKVKEVTLEMEAISGLLSLSTVRMDRSMKRYMKPSMKVIQNTQHIKRGDVYRLFGINVEFPIKCRVKIEVDGQIVSAPRNCEIRTSSTSIYMTAYDRMACRGHFDRGLRLDVDGVVVRVLTSHP
jgi:hypothetical protein